MHGALRIQRPGTPVPAIASLRLPALRLPAAALARLRELLGPAHVRTDPEARIRHACGRSTPDLLRLRANALEAAPDAVVEPGTHEQVLEVLRACASHRIAVVPFGGGTSVVGGLMPRADRFSATVALDLRRLAALVELDEVSRVATLEPGLRGPEAEALLAARGYTLGHFPQSFEYATIGGFAATRSSGQASAGYGRFDERVVRLRVATPRGTIVAGEAPRSAAGPDLRQLLLGSEGAFGVITAVSLELSPLPAVRIYDGWRFDGFADGLEAVRRLAQDGPVPTVLRLSDEVETALDLARPEQIGRGGAAGGCLAITGFEGTAADVARRRESVTAILREAGARPEPDAGPAWERGRYSAPYLRDALLDAGALVETLESAAFWSGVPRLYEAVRGALVDELTAQGTPPVVLGHVSHVYPTGASLYFTVACAQLDDPLTQWRRAKAAACDAILVAGGTITHHHGVGSDHLPWYERQAGELAIGALAAVKRQLDPDGILNPGVLLPQ